LRLKSGSFQLLVLRGRANNQASCTRRPSPIFHRSWLQNRKAVSPPAIALLSITSARLRS
jgi:hypothetical protein